MNKILLPLFAFGAFTVVDAGGIVKTASLPPVEPIVILDNSDSSYYLGLGASYLSLSNKKSLEEFSSYRYSLSVGANVFKYLDIEARYSSTMGSVKYTKGNTDNLDNSDFPTKITNYSFFLKPKYDVYSDFDIYLLLGYGVTSIDSIPLSSLSIADRSEGDFEYGMGATYEYSSTYNLFFDYTREYSKNGLGGRARNSEINSDVFTFGFQYKF